MAGAGAGASASIAAAPPSTQRSKFMMMKSKYKASNAEKSRNSRGSTGNVGSAATPAAVATAEIGACEAAVPVFSADMWTDGATFSPGPQTPMALKPSDDSLPPTPATAVKVPARGPPPVPGAASHRTAPLNIPVIQAPSQKPASSSSSTDIDQSVIDALEAEVEAEAAAAEARKEKRRAAFNKKIKKRASICILSSPKKADAATSRVQSLMSRFEKKHVNRSSLNNVESSPAGHKQPQQPPQRGEAQQQQQQQQLRRAPVSRVVVPAAISAMSPDAIAQRSSSPQPPSPSAIVFDSMSSTATVQPANSSTVVAAAAAEKKTEQARALYKSIAAEAQAAKARVTAPAPAKSQALAAFRSSTGSDRAPSTIPVAAPSAPTAIALPTTAGTTAVVATAAKPLTESAAALLFSSFKPKAKEAEQRRIPLGPKPPAPSVLASPALAAEEEFWTAESTPPSTPQSTLALSKPGGASFVAGEPSLAPAPATATATATALPINPTQSLVAAVLLRQGISSSPLVPKAKAAPQLPAAAAFAAAVEFGITTAEPTRTPAPASSEQFSTPDPDVRVATKKKMKYANTPIDRNILKKGLGRFLDDDDDDDGDETEDEIDNDVSPAPKAAQQMPNRARLMAASATPDSDAESPFMMRSRPSVLSSAATPDPPPVRGLLGLAGFLDSPTDSNPAASPNPVLNNYDHIGAVDDSIMSTGTPRAPDAETPTDMAGTGEHADEQSLSAMKAELDRMNQEAYEEKQNDIEIAKEMEILEIEAENEAKRDALCQAKLDAMNAELAKLQEEADESPVPSPSPSPSPDFGADIDEMTLRLSPFMNMAASPLGMDSPAVTTTPATLDSPAYGYAEEREAAAMYDTMATQISMLDIDASLTPTPTATKAGREPVADAEESFVAGDNHATHDAAAAAAVDTSVDGLGLQFDALTTKEEADEEELDTHAASFSTPHATNGGTGVEVTVHGKAEAWVSTPQSNEAANATGDEVDLQTSFKGAQSPVPDVQDDDNYATNAEGTAAAVDVVDHATDDADNGFDAGASALVDSHEIGSQQLTPQKDAADEVDACLAEGTAPGAACADDGNGNGEEEPTYVVDRLLDTKKDRKGIKWLVKWEGFAESEATWELESKLTTDLNRSVWDTIYGAYSPAQNAAPVSCEPAVVVESAPANVPTPAPAKKIPLYCDVCDQTFKTKPGLGRHMSSKKHAKVVAAKEAEAAANKVPAPAEDHNAVESGARKTEHASSGGEDELQQARAEEVKEVVPAALQIIINETFCTVCDQELRNERGVKRHLGTKKHARALARREEILAEQEMLDRQEAEEKVAAEAKEAANKSSCCGSCSGGDAATAGADVPGAATTKTELSALDILLDTCGQTSVLEWEDALGPKASVDIAKVGEGTFAEVFCGEYNGRMTAFKIMPFDGSITVNDEIQKTSKELVPEVVASVELSALAKSSGDFVAHNFIHLESVTITSGAYPPVLMNEWNAWDKEHGSENETPAIFTEGQLFIVFAFANGGQDLEAFEFSNMEQAKSMLKQICISLAVSEKVIAFEHRDLHWGNILLKATKASTLEYCLSGKKMVVETHGVHSSIIDFTLSRLERNGEPFFFDLETDECYFEGEGDMQFDCYRSMRKAVKKDWSRHTPRTNLYWIQYLIDKVLDEKGYAEGSSDAIEAELGGFYKRVLRYKSMKGLLNDKFFG